MGCTSGNHGGTATVRPIIARIVAAAFALAAAVPAVAAQDCGICARSVNMTPALSQCFLARFEDLSGRGGEIVVVDLSDCETERGVVEALSNPGSATLQPDLEFIVTHPQLRCLRNKIEEAETADEPVVTHDLDTCT